MRALASFCTRSLERIVALALLVFVAPPLAVAAFILRTNTDEPILLQDHLDTRKGVELSRYRFRTTGRGTPVFRAVGRFLRTFSIDEWPGFWSVVTGDIRLSQLRNLYRA